MPTLPPATGSLARVVAIFRQRCPHCFKGPVFRGFVTMNDPCPVCGRIFQREEGYFLGAMYVSYVLGSALVMVSYFVLISIWPEAASIAFAAGLFAAYLPFIPLLFRYSRVIWLHVDHLVTPGDSAAGSYQKLREQQAVGSGTRNPPLA